MSPKHRTGQPAPTTATPKRKGKGGYFDAASSVRAMARALVGRGSVIDVERAPQDAQAKPGGKTWTTAELMQVVRKESLPIRGPHNMSTADLFAAINAARTSPLPGSAATFTAPTDPPDATWSGRLV